MKIDGNEKLIRRGYELFSSGDIDLLHVVLADDVVWHVPGRSPLAGDYKGPDDVLMLLRTLKERTGGTYEVEICTVLADCERAIVLQRERGERPGRSLDVFTAVEFEIHHGRITEVTPYPSDLYRVDAFWAEALET